MSSDIILTFAGVLVLIVVSLVLFRIYKSRRENYSEGALTQLVAKGPQDTYLTGDAWKYMYPIYPYNYDGYPIYGWPYYGYTRVRKSQRPYIVYRYY